ncbi:hypothetical protein ACIRLA_46315 [Streptomyces sp. NPDC102364]
MNWQKINDEAQDWVTALSPIVIAIITTKAMNTKDRERDGPDEDE